MKNRKQKQEEYNIKYGKIPIDYYERLNYMIDEYNITPNKMNEILYTRQNMLNNLYIYRCKIVQLLEDPEGACRPRFRIINKKNFNHEAISNSQFVHVYTPNAKDDYLYMKRLTEETDLIELDSLINTPCFVLYNAFVKTPSSYTVTEKMLSEIGLMRPNIKKPDWDNIGKKYCDTYNHNIWLDDSMVIDGDVRKYYSILPRIEIELRYLNVVYNKKQYISVINRKDYDNSGLSYLDNTGNIISGGIL